MNSLFENVGPLWHSNDPETSREAAEALIESGARDTQKAMVLRLVSRFPGRTSQELSLVAPWEVRGTGNAVARRCSDLKQDGLVQHGERKICDVCGSKCVTWHLTETGQRVFAEIRRREDRGQA